MKNIFKEARIVAKGVVNFSKFITWLWKREIAFYKTKPREALFFLTYRCSSRCEMCDMWKRDTGYEEMDLKGWEKAVDLIAEQGVPLVYLFGGDVLFKKEILFPLTKYASQKGICCDITTNGNLLNQENAKQLVKCGARSIGVSIDAVGDLHDRIRGVKGIFKRATTGIKHMLDARGDAEEPKIKIYCTVSNMNINEFDKVLPLAIDLGVDELHFEPFGEFTKEYVLQSQVNGITANPYYIRQNECHLITIEQAGYLKNKIGDLGREAQGEIYLDTDNIECLSVKDLATGIFPHERCYMTRYHINVDPSGNILPCLFFQNYHIGNIQKTHINEIWGNAKHKDFLRSVENGGLKICQQCICGVQRNPRIAQSLYNKINDYAEKFNRRYFEKNK